MSGHVSVLLPEVIEGLNIDPEGTYWDATAGGGGHAAAILEKLGLKGRLVLTDYDSVAADRVREKFKGDHRVSVFHARFSEAPQILRANGFLPLDGILADLGISSFQLDESEKGISFQLDGPLDMRLDARLEESAADIIAESTADELADLFFQYGGERQSRKIARAIVMDRAKKPFLTTADLSGLAERVLGPFYRKTRIHPATKIFQALRIRVNGELDELSGLLEVIPELTALGARVALISFHSLEDRAIKNRFLELSRGDFSRVTKKPVIPTDIELEQNPRSRSAKLRVIERRRGN